MDQNIRIKLLDLDKDDISKFQITLSNSTTLTNFHFYEYTDGFKEFANELISFPKNINDLVIYEVGKNVKSWAYHMFLKIYCYSPNGYSAIHVKIDNHKELPYSNKVEFAIIAVPASINKLGNLLRDWNPEVQNELIWIAE